jgi:hypothetical protein
MARRLGVIGLSFGAFLMFAAAFEPGQPPLPSQRELASDALQALRDRLTSERAAALLDPRMQPASSGRDFALRHASGAAARVDEHGAVIALGQDAGFRIAVSSIERSDGSAVVAEPRAAAPLVRGAEVARELAPGVVEWWRSIQSGLEHGVTLAQRPRGQGDLIVQLELHGANARASSASSVALLGRDGALLGHYGELLVTDASGAILHASMSVDAGRVRIDIRDRGARYPIVVDPLLRAIEARFINEIGPLNERLGAAVAVSADGTRALVSAPGGVSGNLPNDVYAGDGTVIVLVRSGGSWVEEARLSVESEGPSIAFGVVLALSEDGSVALIGQPNVAGGCVRVFTRDDSTWTEEAVLTAVGSEPLDQFGSAVALSLDGNVALIGAPGANVPADGSPFGQEGLGYVFERVAGEWVQRSTLGAPAPTPSQSFAAALALSGDGSVALVGAPYTGLSAGFEGTAYVFERDGDEWRQTASLVAEDRVQFEQFGFSVALSAAGDVALIGAPGHEGNVGGAHVFERNAAGWTETAVLHIPVGTSPSRLGHAVALSADGTRALLGAPHHDIQGDESSRTGGVMPVARIGDVWTIGAALHGSDPQFGGQIGAAVSLSGDGALAMIGAPFTTIAGTALQVGSVLFYQDDAGSYVTDGQLMFAPEWAELDLGAAVALTATGDRAVVGAPGTEIDGEASVGQARLLRRDDEQWAVEARLRASDGASGDGFGGAAAVSATGDFALVGASFDDTSGGTDAGSVRLFVRQHGTWTEQQTLLAPDGAANDGFGFAVALSHDGQHAIIGAPGKNEGNTDRGCAYVFVHSGGSFTYDSTITLPGADVGAIGIAVAIDGTGTRAIVNARSMTSNQYAPRVLVRDGGTWSTETTLRPEAPNEHGSGSAAAPALLSSFASAALTSNGDRALIGQPPIVQGRSFATVYTLAHFDLPDLCELTDCDAGVDEMTEVDAELPEPLDPIDAAVSVPDAGPRDSGAPDAAATPDAAVIADAGRPAPNDGGASPSVPDDVAANELTSSCSCRIVHADSKRAPYALGLLLAGLLVLGVRRRARS